MNVLFRYSLKYLRRDAPLSRVYRLTVAARDADDARRAAKIADPAFLSTVESPRRGGLVVSR
jgi:hypothetical protein